MDFTTASESETKVQEKAGIHSPTLENSRPPP